MTHIPGDDMEYCKETEEYYDKKTGLTKDEKSIMDNCVEIVNTFHNMNSHHPSHINDVCDAIHVIQRIIQSRQCHRLYPEVYPVYLNKKYKEE